MSPCVVVNSFLLTINGLVTVLLLILLCNISPSEPAANSGIPLIQFTISLDHCSAASIAALKLATSAAFGSACVVADTLVVTDALADELCKVGTPQESAVASASAVATYLPTFVTEQLAEAETAEEALLLSLLVLLLVALSFLISPDIVSVIVPPLCVHAPDTLALKPSTRGIGPPDVQ